MGGRRLIKKRNIETVGGDWVEWCKHVCSRIVCVGYDQLLWLGDGA